MIVILLSFVGSRIVIVVMAILGSDPDFLRALGLEPGDLAFWFFGTGKDLVSTLCQWDCYWYGRVWEGGYDVSPLVEPPIQGGKAPWGFFPLFPMSVRFIAHVLPLSPLVVAYLFNGVCTIAAAWLLYLMVKGHQGHRTGLIAASLFLTSPFSLYLTVTYTEALFNLLSVAAFYMAYQKRWIASGLAMALLTATRPTGLFVALAVAMIAIHQVGLRQLFRIHEHTRITLAFALCPLGICLFALYLYVLHGDALAFSNVQTVAWHNDPQIPLVTIFGDLFKPQDPFPLLHKYNAVVAVIGLCLAVLLARVGPLPEAVFLGVVMLVSTTVSTWSAPRYAFGIWPTYLLFAILLSNRPIVPLVLPFLFTLGLAIFTLGWVNAAQWLI